MKSDTIKKVNFLIKNIFSYCNPSCFVGKAVMDACKQLMMMHRGGLFMPERIHYKQRVTEAIVHYPDKVMSSIIDGKNSRTEQLCFLALFKLSKLFFHILEIHILA